MTKHTAHDHATHTRLLVRVLQDVSREATFEREADLKEAAKARCARLRIAYDSGALAEALDRFEQGGRQRMFHVEHPGGARPRPSLGRVAAPLLVGDGDRPARPSEGRWNEAERALFRQQWRQLTERRR
jgi:hypothetical protein